MTLPVATHESGTPRPTIRLPSDRCAASESSSTMLALAMPQACGDEPLPASGCVPVRGAGQPPFPVTGVVGGAVVLRRVAAEGVRRELADQPGEAVVVRGVDQADPGAAERRAEQVA